jgi:hypothetical protein
VHLRAVRSRSGPHATFPGRRPPTNRLRLWASAARTARPCGESVLELAFQTLGRDALLCLNLHGDVDPDPCGLERDDLHVVGHVLPVRMVVALAFFKRIFPRPLLPMNQAHSLIVAEVYEAGASAQTRRSVVPAGRKTGKRCGSAGQSGSHRPRWSRVRSHPRSRLFENVDRRRTANKTRCEDPVASARVAATCQSARALNADVRSLLGRPQPRAASASRAATSSSRPQESASRRSTGTS